MNKKPKTIELDEDEKEILSAFENNELILSKSSTDYREIVRNTLKTNRNCLF
jgi:hypothetical protein